MACRELLRDKAQLVWRAIQSRTVLSAIAGLIMHAAVKKGWIPSSLASDSAEALTWILCIYFRVIATQNLAAGGAL